jgi:uncharacterized protein
MKPVLIDTSFLAAVYNRSDFYHVRCIRALETLDRPMATCEAVISESLFLLPRAKGAAEAILASVEQGALEIRFSLANSPGKVGVLLKKYSNIPAALADACLIQMADELDTGDILTLDSDFEQYRWRRNRAFNLLIPLD